MKIGFFIISDGWSGAENALHSLLKSLIKQDREITLFLNKEIKKYYLDIKELKVVDVGKMDFKKSMNVLKNCIKSSRKLYKLIKELKIDVIMLFLEGSIIISSLVNKKIDIPIITSLRGEETNIYNKGFSFKNLTKLHIYIPLKKILKISTRIHSHNSWQTKSFNKKLKRKLIMIPNGINTKTFKRLKGVKQKENIILFAGRYIDWKGINEMINVAKQLPQYEFWFAGQGPLDNKIKGNNIKNLGFKTTKELVKLYNQATICIFPSWHEPFGNVAREAMACQKAVIATPKGFSETIENGKDGIIIPAKDEDALKNAILDLMTHEKKRKMLEKNARKKALKYSWDKVAEKYYQLCKEAVRDYYKK